MLPSKKILIALAILIVGIGALAWYGYSKGSNTNYDNSNQNLLSVATSSIDVTASQIDSDHDGLPDVWMMQYFGHTNSLASDHSRPQDDPDGDGATNQDEYIAGTHPRDPSSCLRIDRITKAGGVTLTFLAVSNHTYTVQFTDPLTPAVWQNWTRCPAVSTNNLQSVVDPTALTNRFYRLVTPWQP